jgi:tetratricopeptide (TPR) repeat protein
MKRGLKFALFLCLMAFCVVASGCGFINRLRAKDQLNKGVIDYNRGKYEEAQAKFKRALEIKPDLANAQLFYARALNARFDRDMTEELGLETIAAYEALIQNSQSDPRAVDQALAFQSKVYEQLSGIVSDNPAKAEEYKQKHRQKLLKRAEMTTDDRAKADVYYTIGQDYWQECYNLSRPYTKIVGGSVQYLPIPTERADKMRPLILKAHEYLQRAISFKPDYANAWIYEKLVYMEEAKLEKDPKRRQELEQKIKEADEKYKKYHEQEMQAGQPQASN